MKTIEFDSIDSTNTYLKENYEKLDDLTFVSALLQTAGRGRNNRRWLAEKGSSLMFSLLLKDHFYLDNYRCLSVLAAYNVVKVLEKYQVRDLMIKWPNDVYAGGKKICGILLEAVSRNQLECLIIGTGINVLQESFEGDYLHMPTSLFLETGRKVDLEQFKKEVYESFINSLNRLKEGHDFHQEIVQYDYLKGKEVYACVKGVNRAVKVMGINHDYSLKISFENVETDIDSGEISFHP